MSIRRFQNDPDEEWPAAPNAPWLLLGAPNMPPYARRLLYVPHLDSCGAQLFRRPPSTDCVIVGRRGLLEDDILAILEALDVEEECTFVGDLSPFHVFQFLQRIEEDSSRTWRWRGVSLALESYVDPPRQHTSTLAHYLPVSQRHRERRLWNDLLAHYCETLQQHFAPEDLEMLTRGYSITLERVLARHRSPMRITRLRSFMESRGKSEGI